MKIILFLIVLFFTHQSFSFTCPESTDLNDKSSRDRCINNVLTHWQQEIEKRIIKKWQGRFKNGGLASAGQTSVIYSQQSNFDLLIKIQKLLDPIQDTGFYKPLPDTLTCSNNE